MKSYRRQDYHRYSIRFYVKQHLKPCRADVDASNVEDAIFSFNEDVKDSFPGMEVAHIISIRCDGKPLPKHIVDAMNGSYLDECDGCAAASGDAGAASSTVAGDVASGITSGEVLGSHDHNSYDGGFFGTDCFHIPAKVKVPFHRWEICNGGSKRKKTKNGKDKKYAYEKGMKVVVDMFENEQMLNEYDTSSTYDKLHGADWEYVKSDAIEKAEKRMRSKPPFTVDPIAIKDMVKNLYYRWQAAQLPPPDTAKYGEINACGIDEDKFRRDYLKEYFIHGWYDDGTMLELGPMSKQVASAYISLHKLSANSIAFQKMKADGFAGVHEVGHYIKDDKLIIIKTTEGFWLYSNENKFKAGTFANKQLAMMYAMSQGYKMDTKNANDQVDEPGYLKYPTFAFSYTMAGVPCMDIVVAEDINKAMKLFDFQWRVFDNTRPIKQTFNSINDLQRDLSLLRIKDIEIEELNADNVDEYTELADATGNPSTIDSLKSRCRNPKFRYILGRDTKTGRSLVRIEW